MKFLKIFSIAIFCLFFSTIIKANSPTAELDKAAPNFTLVDTKGVKHSLSDYKGKYVVLEWINFGCPFVKKHYDPKNMQSLQAKYTSKNVVWLSICSSNKGKEGNMSSDEINKKLNEIGYKGSAYLIDEDGTVGKMYGAKTTPHMYIINPAGNLCYVGAIDDKPSTDKEDIKTSKNYVSAGLDELLSGKAVTTKSTKSYGCGIKY